MYLRDCENFADGLFAALSIAVFLTDPSPSPPPPQLTTLELAGVEGRSNLWPKVKAGLVAAWERYQDR